MIYDSLIEAVRLEKSRLPWGNSGQFFLWSYFGATHEIQST